MAAFYEIIRDAPFNLQIGAGNIDVVDFNFSLNGPFFFNTNAILSFMLRRVAGAVNDLQFRITLNGSNIITYGPSDENFSRAFHEIIDPFIMHPQGSPQGGNILRIRLLGGQGVLRMSDIVIWYQG